MGETGMGLRRRADALLGEAVSRRRVPGVIAMVTDREVNLYDGAFGERALGGGETMAQDTVIWLASMTKPITATAAMQLVERGALDLDSPASRWLPELADTQVLEGFDDTGEPLLRPPRRPVTLRHLLTHTAGFGYSFWSAEILRFQERRGIPDSGSGENAALKTPLLFDPGDHWGYGIGIDWAGKLVEAASGLTLGAFMKENILEPLGMASTAFRITSDMRGRLAKVHQRDDDGMLEAIDWEFPQEPEFEEGGGALYGTVGDYVRFVRMILNRGRADRPRVLEENPVALMSANQIGACRVNALKTAMPKRSNDVEFFPGIPKGWGFSFMINLEPAPTGRSAGSLAWAGMANTYFWIDPAKGLGGVFATQILPFADTRALPLYLDFETAVYAAIA